MSDANHNNLSSSLIGLHDPMSLANFIEAEDPRWLHVEPTGSGIFGDLLERHIRQGEAGSSERETRKEGKINAACHLQRRIKVGNWVETAEPPGQTRTTTPAEYLQRIKHDTVTD
jgi:hypothetical protein